MKITPLLAAAAIVAAGSAHAGGVTSPAPEPQPQFAPVVVSQSGWTGGYVGASLGYGDADAEYGEEPLAVEGEGVIGGLFAGYQRDFGSVVLGAEFDANAADVDADIEDLSGYDGIEFGLNRLHRLKLRAGYDAGNALVYGVVGAAYANAHEESDELGEFDYEDWGYVIGVGSDVRVGDNVTVGAEVLYHQFDDLSDDPAFGFEADIVTFQARVAYRF